MGERLSNLGYLSLIKETTKGTPLTPTDYLPLFEESMNTIGNFADQKPIYGNKYENFNTLKGVRSHKGSITTIAEPNTTAKLADMLLTKISTTGSSPYVHTFGLSNTTDPNSYTIDISTGNVVARYWGVQASSLAPVWNGPELNWKLDISALGSLQTRTIANISTTTITLSAEYDPVPNKGFVVGDLVRFYKSATGAVLDTTIATVDVDGVTVTVGTSAAAFAAGDTISLRPATPSFSPLIQTNFTWPKNYWKFGADLSAAASAAQTRLEQGSNFTINHAFESDDGAARSGGFDPAALVRALGSLELNIKKYFDTPEDIAAFNALSKSALVIQHKAGTTNQYGATLNVNHLKTDGMVVPDLKAGDIQYAELKPHPIYDTSDGLAFNFVVTNELSTI